MAVPATQKATSGELLEFRESGIGYPKIHLLKKRYAYQSSVAYLVKHSAQPFVYLYQAVRVPRK